MQIVATNYSTNNKKAIKYFEKAQLEMNYAKRLKLYEKALKKDPKFAEAYWGISDLYQFARNWALAKNQLLEALKNQAYLKNNTYIKLANLEYIQENYNQAIAFYLSVDTLELSINEKQHFKKQLHRWQTIHNIYDSPLDYKPINMTKINTTYDDYFPSITADGKMLCSTVRDREYRHTQGEDIYKSYNKKGVWSYSKPLNYPVNTTENEGSQSFSADGRYIFFVRCNGEDSYGSCDIYYAQKFGNKWGELHHFDAPINSSFWDSTPVMSPLGDKLYFASSRPGGMGKSDIWVADISIQEDGSITSSKVSNLGPPINTSENENSPFIHTNNITLFFASDGHIGLGGMDIYKVEKKGEHWGEVINMGYPLNTSADNFGFSVNAKGNKAYYSSFNKNNRQQGLDIYQVSIPKERTIQSMRTLYGTITNSKTSKAIQSKVEIYNQFGNQSYSQSLSDRKTGEFMVFLPDTGQYGLSVNDSKYVFYSANILSNQDSMNIQLTPLSENRTFQLNNLFFATNQANILPKSQGEMNRLHEFMVQNINWDFSIEGHTDNVGSTKYNKDLSLRRANSVKQALMELGIDSQRLTIKGYGSSQPIANNTTQDGRAKNRRVVIRLIKPE